MHIDTSDGKTGVQVGRRPGAGSFWLIASLLALLMFAASAPSPLYPTYAAQWHLSAITVTAVFAVYAVTLLVALLVLGSLSDHIGRRPVIIGALAAEAVAMVVFLGAHGLTALYVARGVQGLATGAAAPVAGRGLAARTAMTAGCFALIAGLAVTAVAIEQLAVWLLMVGSAIAGAGFGLSFMGAFRTVTASAAAGERAALIASVYTASYLAFSIPAVVAGVVTTHVGLRSTSIGYACAVALLAAVAVAGSAVVHRGHRPRPESDVPPCPCSVPAAQGK